MYKQEDLVSRFFLYSDVKETHIMWDLLPAWWSRSYEYIWAARFIQPEDIVLDSACGIGHPFKFYLVDKCREVFACDMDERILSKEAILEDIRASGQYILDNFDSNYIDKINIECCYIDKTPYSNEQFDKIVSISVFEHLEKTSQLSAFEEFSRILKDDGLLLLTVDYPLTQPQNIVEQAAHFNLKLAGDIDYTLTSNAVTVKDGHTDLYCFRLVFIKDQP